MCSLISFVAWKTDDVFAEGLVLLPYFLQLLKQSWDLISRQVASTTCMVNTYLILPLDDSFLVFVHYFSVRHFSLLFNIFIRISIRLCIISKMTFYLWKTGATAAAASSSSPSLPLLSVPCIVTCVVSLSIIFILRFNFESYLNISSALGTQ